MTSYFIDTPSCLHQTTQQRHRLLQVMRHVFAQQCCCSTLSTISSSQNNYASLIFTTFCEFYRKPPLLLTPLRRGFRPHPVSPPCRWSYIIPLSSTEHLLYVFALWGGYLLLLLLLGLSTRIFKKAQAASRQQLPSDVCATSGGCWLLAALLLSALLLCCFCPSPLFAINALPFAACLRSNCTHSYCQKE